MESHVCIRPDETEHIEAELYNYVHFLPQNRIKTISIEEK